MILASLALAAIEPPQARLDRLHGQIVAAIPELCAQNACPRPVIGKTSRCAVAKGFTVTADPKCAAKLSDDELAFVLAHEFAHVSTGTTSERGADWLAYSLIVRAGFDGKRAVQVFDKFKLAAFNIGRQFND